MPAVGLFVSGTDTGVGKTAVAAVIARSLVTRGLRVGVYKPVASGATPDDAASDARRLWEAANRPRDLAAVCPQSFAAPLAPSWAAREEGRTVDERLLRDGLTSWLDISDIVIVEGAGGLFSPVGERSLGCDLARDLGFPLVIVDQARLGAIGRTLATVRAARAEGLRIAAVVLSMAGPPTGDPEDPAGDLRIARDNAAELSSRLGGMPVAALGYGAAVAEPDLDWLALASRA